MVTRQRWLVSCFVLMAVVASPASPVLAQNAKGDWPQFLGPNRDGISTETGLMKKWPEGGPKVVWRAPGGIGMSGVAIVGNRALTLVERRGKQMAICLNTENGKLVWEKPVADAYTNGQGAGPRATPTVVGKQVFVFTGDGKLAALELANGSIQWTRNVIRDNKGKIAEYGMASSPLVVGKNVIVSAGCPSATVVAYNIATGEPTWKYTQSDAAGYSSPALRTVAGRPQVVAVSGGAAFGLDARTGRPFWRYAFVTDFNCNIATPILFGKNLFISSGENHGAAMLGFKPASDGFAVTEKWTSLGRRSVMRNEWQTSILADGHLYGFDNVGGAGPISHLNCVNASTGERVWQQQRFGKGNMIAADGKLFMTTTKGELIVAKISSEQYIELGRIELMRPTRQAPSLSRGRLYLRDDKDIICVDVSAK